MKPKLFGAGKAAVVSTALTICCSCSETGTQGTLERQVEVGSHLAQQVGRYQVVCTPPITTADGTVHLVLKVDSATGETWKYQAAVVPTGLPDKSTVAAEGWILIPDSFSKSFEEARSTAEEFKSGRYRLGK